MTDKAISPLRRRLIEDMAIRRLGPKTQHDYIRHVKRFADFLGRSVDKATGENIHRYQLWLASIGTTVPTVNVSATALRFFFKVTLKRRDLAEEVVSTREPRRLPIVLSPEEVGRLLASATNIKHKALLVNAALHRQTADHSVRHHRFGCTRGAQNHGRGTPSVAVPVRKSKIRSNTGAKSP